MKGSKFIGQVMPVSDHEEVGRILHGVREELTNATHVCYAYRLVHRNDDLEEFSTDAGEPEGSAGIPILNILRRSSLVNVVAWVARYYGGTKLGIPGLISAYGETARRALERVRTKPWVVMTGLDLTLPYPLADRVKGEVEKAGGVMVDEVYAEAVFLKVNVPKKGVTALVKLLQDMGAGMLQIVSDGD
ncbi:MAG: YigZ family protein [Fidelibacterota bacterium]|nr:MAG: YigZ family protein [Candidatus Neomarinimicrobiota bacterium]